MEDNANRRVSSSFRDPCGFLFYRDGTLYRQINNSYKENYERLIDSGLYTALVDAEFLIPHEEIDSEFAESDTAFSQEPCRFFGESGAYIDARTNLKAGDETQPRYYPDMPVVIGVIFILGS